MEGEDDGWQGVNAALARFGAPSKPADRPDIVAVLEEQVRLEADEVGNQSLMRLLCGLLFSLSRVEDSLLVCVAGQAVQLRTHCGIDVAFLCGAWLNKTKAFLSATEEAAAALEYIRHCTVCGNFAEFSIAGEVAELRWVSGGVIQQCR